MKKTFAVLILLSFFVSSFSFAKWVDPEKEARKHKKVKAWSGIDFVFTGFSAANGTSSVLYHTAINDLWEWNAGTGIDGLGWFFTGGGRYFVYNWPKTTCFFAFPCHGQVTAGANVTYANGGRKSYNNSTGTTKYEVGSSMYALPTVGFRSIYQEFFSLSLDVGYRFMIQEPSIRRVLGTSNQSNIDDMEKASKNGIGASLSLGIVF